MKKGVLLLLLLLVIVVGCTSEKPAEPTISDTPSPAEIPAVKVEPSLPAATVETPSSPPEQKALVEEKSTCSRTFIPQFSSAPHYGGPLFDAHFHMPTLIDFNIAGHDAGPAGAFNTATRDPVLGKDVELKNLLCTFDKENVVGAIGFTIGIEEKLGDVVREAKQVNEESSGKIKLFLMPGMFKMASLDTALLADADVFSGFGEMAFYVFPYLGVPPDAPSVMEVYALAEKHKLVVMMHPNSGQAGSIETMLKKYPNVRFLLHGPEIENSIASLVAKYPNVYYSIDAILIRPSGSPGGLIYTTNSVSALKAAFTQNYDQMLSSAVNTWKATIEKHPDRFLWGTDRAYLWHYDEEVSRLLEEFGRDFIAELDPTVQEKFAYKNAQKLISR